MASIDWPKLEEITAFIANAQNAFVVGHGERRDRGRRIIQFLVDTDDGITISQCAEISRQLGLEIDARGIINDPYDLEVSSPGIDKPLKLLRQYKKNIGRKYKVKYLQNNERRTFSGTLSSVEGDRITFMGEEEGTLITDFSNIVESVEELPW